MAGIVQILKGVGKIVMYSAAVTTGVGAVGGFVVGAAAVDFANRKGREQKQLLVPRKNFFVQKKILLPNDLGGIACMWSKHKGIDDQIYIVLTKEGKYNISFATNMINGEPAIGEMPEKMTLEVVQAPFEVRAETYRLPDTLQITLSANDTDEKYNLLRKL